MENIYTIPVNEAFDACLEEKNEKNANKNCPFCEMRRVLEENELELILGASMMEPDTRIKTNEQGFCKRHFSMLLRRKNRLGLALILESHLAHVEKEAGAFLSSDKKLTKIESSCYICQRIDYHFVRMIGTAVDLYESDRGFADKVGRVPYYCLGHYNAFLSAGKKALKRSAASDFERTVKKVNDAYLKSIQEDVSWFCKKFDYRYDAEPWGNAKDSPERAIRFLAGDDTDTGK